MARVKQIWKELSNLLDIHGLHQINDAKSTGKVVWTALLVLATFVLIGNLYIATSEFLSNPILTTYSFQSKSTMQFPKLYLCPFNPVNRTVVKFNKYTRSVIDSMLADYLSFYKPQQGVKKNGSTKQHQGGASRASANSVLDQKLSSMEIISHKLAGLVKHKPNGPAPAMSQTEIPTWKQWCETFGNETIYEFFKRIGYSEDEFIKECSFEGEPLNCLEYVTPVFDMDHGKCFILDLKGITQTSPGSGLSLLIDIWTDLYYSKKTRVAMFEGASLKIERYTDPTSSNELLLRPGQYLKIQLKHKLVKIINNTVGHPKQSCSGNGRKLDIFSINYTQSACRLDCLQIMLHQQCNCILPFDPIFISKKYQNITPCSATNHSSCTSRTLVFSNNFQSGSNASEKELWLKSCVTNCKTPCEHDEYSTTQSSTIFPSSAYIAAHHIPNPGVDCMSGNDFDLFDYVSDPLPHSYNCDLPESMSHFRPTPPLPIIDDRMYFSQSSVFPETRPYPPAPIEGAARSTPAPREGAARPTPAPREGAARPTTAPTEGAAHSTPAPREDAARPTPAPREGAARPTPAPREGAARPTPAPREGAARLTPAQREAAARPTPDPTPTDHSYNSESASFPDPRYSPPVFPPSPNPKRQTFDSSTPDYSETSIPCSDLPPYHARFDTSTWPHNYILLDLAFETLQTETIEQNPSMTFNMFISNIGGQFGLWIGASLFTLIQLAVYVSSCCCQMSTVDEQMITFNEYSPELDHDERELNLHHRLTKHPKARPNVSNHY